MKGTIVPTDDPFFSQHPGKHLQHEVSPSSIVTVVPRIDSAMMVTLLLVSNRHLVAGHRSQSFRNVRPGLFARETFNPRRCNHLLSPYFILGQAQRGKSACRYLGLEAQKIQNTVLRRV
ncbi:unnamed protein product [Ectocarpus sp. 13 AM-2016]